MPSASLPCVELAIGLKVKGDSYSRRTPLMTMWKRYTLLLAAVIILLGIWTGMTTGSRLVWVVFGLTLLLVGGLGWYIEQEVIRPARRLRQEVERAVAGEKGVGMWRQRRGEIGRLSQTLATYQDHVQEEHGYLTHQLKRLQTVFAQMADGVIITTPLGNVQMANLAALKLFSQTHDQVIDRSFAEVVRHHDIIHLWQRCMETNEPHHNVIEVRGGLFLQVDCTPLNEAGVRAGCVILLHDLTSVHRLETVRRDFISNISHELRTPLASLRAVVDTLHNGALDDPPIAQRFLARADHEVDALTQMVQELFELSRIESGRVPLKLTSTAIDGVIENVIGRMHSAAERKHLTIEKDIAKNLPPVLVDPPRIEQVLTNLLHNAIKFSLDGGTVTIVAKPSPIDAGFIQVSVQDNGVGIPKHALSRIFERFYKIDRARTSGQGTGLGLAIAKHLIQVHGGKIWATSRENKGSTFYFTLQVSGE